MTIFYQHIGEAMWARDAPRSLGTHLDGVMQFIWRDIEPYLGEITPYELMEAHNKVTELASTGFQVWGIPSGARRDSWNRCTQATS